MNALNNKIFTIGHSNRTAAFFVEMLRSFDVTVLADVRSMPGSKWVPQFNSKALSVSLQENNIRYMHYPALGGRIPKPDMPRDAASKPFSAYRAYMETDAFVQAIGQLQTLARTERVAYMCAEANWWQCHRSKISDYLTGQNWEVVHIMGIGKSALHIIGDDGLVQGSLF